MNLKKIATHFTFFMKRLKKGQSARKFYPLVDSSQPRTLHVILEHFISSFYNLKKKKQIHTIFIKSTKL